MIHTLKNTPITWYKGLEFIKRICYQAYKERKLKENPFKNLQINRLKGNSGHLTVDELKSLDVPLDERSQIIGDTKEVVSNHYTKEDMSVTMKARDKYSQAMKVKKEEPGQDQVSGQVTSPGNYSVNLS